MIGEINVTVTSRHRLWPRLLASFVCACGLGWPTLAIAQPLERTAPIESNAKPLDLENFQAGLCPDSVAGITDQSASSVRLTLPSLWWIRDQVAAQPQFGHKLLEKWLACTDQPQLAGHVDVLVNPQVWTLLDYLDRYEFVHRLGTVTSGYGYNLRIFNRQLTVLAAYTCQFESPVPASEEMTKSSEDRAKARLPEGQSIATAVIASPRVPGATVRASTCTLTLDPSSKGGFRGQPNASGGDFPIGSGTGQ
jgi:hypothetical protein